MYSTGQTFDGFPYEVLADLVELIFTSVQFLESEPEKHSDDSGLWDGQWS